MAVPKGFIFVSCTKRPFCSWFKPRKISHSSRCFPLDSIQILFSLFSVPQLYPSLDTFGDIQEYPLNPLPNLYRIYGSFLPMAGHSHWQNIKYQKARKDIQKAAEFGKISKAIKTAVKIGGYTTENAALSQHIENAKKIGFPKAKIQNAIRSGLGAGAGSDEVVYEGRGPGNISLMVFVSTDNRHRSTQQVKHIISKHGGSVGIPGTSAFLFKKVGVLVHKSDGKSENELFDIMLESDVEEYSFVDTEKTEIKIETQPNNLFEMKTRLEALGLHNVVAEIQHVPHQVVDLESDAEEDFQKMLSALNDLDDVMEIVHNASFVSNKE